MQRRKLWLTGGVALAGAAVYRVFRRRSEPDPALELRKKLDESRALTEEREEFEGAEVPVDLAEPGPDERRREIHERGRAALEEMQEPPGD